MTSRTLTLLAAATLGITGFVTAQTAGQGTGTASDPSMSTGTSQSGTTGTQSGSMQSGSMQSSSSSGSMDQKITDQDFVRRAASSGQYEVDASKWAQDKVKDPQIKQLAKTMESDHKEANNELKRIARQSNIDVPSSPQESDKQMLSQLKQTDEQQAGQTYVQQQIQAHQKAVDLFRQAQNQLQDPQLKSFAQRTLPKLEQHLQHLQQISSSAQPAGGTIPGSSGSLNQPDQSNQPGMSNPSGSSNQSGSSVK